MSATAATKPGLQYLSEAHLDPLPAPLAPRALQTLAQAADLIRQEQYLDFVRNRTFRQTLLCHDAVQIRRPPEPERVTTMFVRALARPEAAQPDVCSTAVERFSTAILRLTLMAHLRGRSPAFALANDRRSERARVLPALTHMER